MLKHNLSYCRHIEVVPQGLAESFIPICISNAQKARQGKLKIGYIGRACEIKGCHLLVAATASLPDNLDFELHIYGCNPKEKYYEYLLTLSKANPRIFFHELLPLMEIIKKYSELDVLCLPSMVYETGPLTLLEGVYSGCFVAGSENIGQMDFLKKFGKCLQCNTVQSWSDFFQECYNSLESIRQNRRSIFEQYRTMETVAKEILEFTGI